MYKIYTRKPGTQLSCFQKILLVMRLTTVMLIISLMQVSAAGLAQRVTLNERNASLDKLFREMRRQTGYDFLFNIESIKESKRVDVNIKNVPLEEALNSCLNGSSLTYAIEEKTVIIKKKTPSFLERVVSSFAAIDVRGRVVDEKGKPLPGATVRVKDSHKAVLTNDNGEFLIKGVDEKAVLLVSYLGFRPKEVQAAVNLGEIRMEISAGELQELSVTVNTGYQTLSKERSAGSFAKPDMNIIGNRTGSMNILQRLDGLIAGLTVNNAPNASQNPFLVRGLSTVGVLDNSGVYSGTNRNPLFVVDGIPIDNVSAINPQDVADITVLKDATAASIWGARASNGVIVITTKKGEKDEKLSISYDAFINFQGRPDLDYFRTLSSRQFIQAANETFDPVTNPWETVSDFFSTGGTGVAPHELIQYNLSRGVITATQAKASLDSLSVIDNRRQIKDLWYRNASLMNHTLSFSVGGNKYSLYGSGAYTNTVSDRPGDKNNAYKINLRQDLTIGKFIQLNLITDLSNNISSARRNIQVNNNFYSYQLFRDNSGNNISIPYMGELSEEVRIDFQNRSRVNLDYNPLDEFNYGYTKDNNFLSRNVLGLNIRLLDGLKFEGTYGYIKGSGKTEVYDDAKSYLVRNELVQFTVAPTVGSTPVYYLPNNGGRYSLNNTNQQNWTLRNQLSYNKSWNRDMHQLTALLGQEAQEQLLSRTGNTVRGYNELLQTSGAVDYLTLGLNGVMNPVMPNNFGRSVLRNDLFSQSELRSRFTSYYTNIAYTYNRRYTVNGSFRIDKSNLFGLDKSAQNRPVWSIGGKWIASSEAFMAGVQWLNNLALRATYGLTGNSPVPGTASSFDILSAVQSGNYPGGVALNIATPSNSKLTWESTRAINIGVDFGLVNNRINGAIELYRKRTSDLLGILPTNTFSGYANITGNLGDLENKGIELSLNTLNIQTGNFKWNTIFNIAYNKNTITKLNLSSPVTRTFYRVRQDYAEGYPAFALFAYRFAGLDQLGDPQIQLADGSITKTPNEAKIEDVRFMGTYQPVWSGGLANVFNYKNFTLSANAIFNLGHVMRNDVNRVYSNRIAHSNIQHDGFTTGNLHADFANRWKQPGDELLTNIPSYVANTSLSFTRRDIEYYTYADINVLSASYVKLRDITLAYSLPAVLTGKLKADQIALRVQLSNLMLWKANDADIDPEYHHAIYGSRSMPVNRGSLSFGINVKF